MHVKLVIPDIEEVFEEVVSLIVSFVMTVISINYVVNIFVAPLIDQITRRQPNGALWVLLGTFVFLPTFVLLFSMYFVISKTVVDKYFNKNKLGHRRLWRNLFEYSISMLLALVVSFFTVEIIVAIVPSVQKLLFGIVSSANDPYTPLVLYLILIMIYFYSFRNFDRPV